jgi:DNA-binding protein HU-beta
MNKAELVEQIANQTGLTKRASSEVVEAMISTITDSLGREEKSL